MSNFTGVARVNSKNFDHKHKKIYLQSRKHAIFFDAQTKWLWLVRRRSTLRSHPRISIVSLANEEQEILARI